jgi:hypothetical protein
MAIGGSESEGEPMNLIPGPASPRVGRRLAMIFMIVITGLLLWAYYLSWREGRDLRRVEETEPDAHLPG